MDFGVSTDAMSCTYEILEVWKFPQQLHQAQSLLWEKLDGFWMQKKKKKAKPTSFENIGLAKSNWKQEIHVS